jgi:hypothetical protein
MENGQKYPMQRSTRSSRLTVPVIAIRRRLPVNAEQGAVNDGDKIETQVADEIVEQALDAVVLLARDPRYAELVR